MNEQPAMFYFPWNRAWELLIGAALAEYLSRPHAPLKPALASTLSLAGIGLITAAIALIDKDDIFPGWLATIPTLGSALLIAAGTRAWPNRLLGLKPIVVIGLISYPLYLWHWPLLVFARIIEGGEPSAVIRAGALAVSTVLAGLTYVILERPLRTGGRITITALSATIIMVGCVGYSAGKEFLKPRSSLSGLDAVINAYDDWGYDVDGRYLYKKNRFEQIGDAETITAFIGDSNAQQYFPRISTVIDADRANHQRAIYAWTGGCPPIKHVKKRGRRCAERMDAAYNMIMETPDINRVVIAALWRNYFIESQDYYYENNGIRYELNAQETKEGIEKAYVELEHMVEDFRQEGKVVYIILNIPIGPELESRTLISRSWKTLGIALTKSPDGISRASFSEEMAPVTERLTAIAKRTGSTVLDPIPWLCGPERCRPLTEKGWPIYKDRAHITASFAREHLHELDQTIRK